MIKVLFVCHGNICRSPMAEFVFRDMVKKKGLEQRITIASAATSTEEIGNEVHPGTKRILGSKGISTQGKRAIQMTRLDYDTYDYIIAMDQSNIVNIHKMFGADRNNKVAKLLDYTNKARDIADPWYTGDFEQTYEDVYEGCEAFLEELTEQHKLY